MNVMFASLLAIATTATAGSDVRSSNNVVMKGGSVETFYGVPKTLKLSELRSLPFVYKEGLESGGEGMTVRTVSITARDNVKITVVFNRRGESVEVRTASRHARDPRGVKVGDKLSYVRKAWPEGKLYYGASIEGGQPYAVFMTGTNVILDLSDNILDMKRDPSRVRVEEIKIVGYPAKL